MPIIGTSALVVFLTACGGQIVRRAFQETALRLKIGERLGRERDELVHVHFPRPVFDELNQLAANALVFVRGIDVEGREFPFAVFGVSVQGHARHRVLINLEDEIVPERFFDDRSGALDQLIGLRALLRQQLEGAHVLFLGRTDVLILVGVNQRADAFVGKNFREQALVHASVDDVDALHAGPARGPGVLRLGQYFGGEFVLVFFQQRFQLTDQHLANELAAAEQAVGRRDENQLHGFERVGDGDRDVVRIDPIRFPIAIEAQRRNHGQDALRQQRLQQVHVHAFDLAGEQMVHALQDAHRVRNDGVRAGGAEVVGGETLEDFVRQAVGPGQGELERGGIRHAAAVEVGRLDVLFVRQRLDLRGRAVDEDDADVERAQHRQVQQDVGEVLVGDDRAVNADDEGPLAELRNVLQDAPQVGWFHAS